MNCKSVPLRELFSVFFKIGSVTFGGGYAMLPILDRELAEKRKWVKEEELLDYYAIGQSTPGIIAINTATFVGYKCAGLAGAVTATLGMIWPSLIIIILIASSLNRFEENLYVQKALRGVNIAVTVLLLSSVWKFSRKTLGNLPSVILCAGAFLAVGFFAVSPLIIVVLASLLGLFRGLYQLKGSRE